MGSENRTVTIVAWGATQDASATPPEINCPRYSDLNAWQDGGVRCMSCDGTMTPAAAGFEDVEGALRVYCQTTLLPTGAADNLVVTNPNNYNTQLDMRNRLVHCTVWTENTAAELPGGGLYDPDTFVNAPLEHLWFTQDGASDGTPPTGDFWTPFGNIYIYAQAAAPYQLRCYNNSGATIYLVMMGTITQQIG